MIHMSDISISKSVSQPNVLLSDWLGEQGLESGSGDLLSNNYLQLVWKKFLAPQFLETHRSRHETPTADCLQSRGEEGGAGSKAACSLDCGARSRIEDEAMNWIFPAAAVFMFFTFSRCFHLKVWLSKIEKKLIYLMFFFCFCFFLTTFLERTTFFLKRAAIFWSHYKTSPGGRC